MKIEESARILLLTIGNIDHGSSRLRGLAYREALKNKSCDVRWIPRIPRKSNNWFEKLLFPFIKRIQRFKTIIAIRYGHYDLVIVQKLFLNQRDLSCLKKSNTPYLFDFDDAIYLDDKDLDAALNTKRMVENASIIVVSSPVLSSYCNNLGRDAKILTTPVNTDKIKASEHTENQRLTIIWIGSPWTTHFIKIAIPALKTIAEEFPVSVKLVGSKPGFHHQDVDFETIPWSEANEIDCLSKADIGIMPLTDDPYSQGKGGFKLLLYMAAGLPVVASPVGINKEIVHDGKTGFLCTSEADWINALRRLLSDPELRLQLGMAGRQLAESTYSLNIFKSKLITLLYE